jgi:GNAT superfamily N-acetyltransferase
VDHDAVRVRPYQPGDLDDLYRVCLLTAFNGADGTAVFRDPRLPGQVYAAPYAIFEPCLTTVAQDADGVAGYIVAALDSLAFEHRLEQDWWPVLRPRYPEPPADLAGRLSAHERRAIQNIHHPLQTAPELAERFPSQLHINLLWRLQGRGIGRRLIQTLIAQLRARGSRGLHLGAGLDNHRAAGFFRAVGFTEMAVTDWRLFVMDLTGDRLRHPAFAQLRNKELR